MHRRRQTDVETTSLFVRTVPPLIAAAGMLAMWSGAIRYWQIPPYLIPPPAEVLAELVKERGLLARAFVLTGTSAISGLALSLLVGTAIGTLFAQSKILRYAFYPYAIFLQTVPIVAIAPLLVMWLGYGPRGVVAVAFVLSLFPIIASVTAGMLSVPTPMSELFHLYRASRWQRLLKLEFPYAISQLATGAKTSSGLSVIGAIVGEFFVGYGGGGFGLGYLIRNAADGYQTASLFAAVVLSTLLGISVFVGVSTLSEFVLQRWGQRSS